MNQQEKGNKMWKIVIFVVLIFGCSTVQKVQKRSDKEHCINGYVKYECVDPNVGEGMCIKKDDKGSAIECWGWE